MGSRTIFEPNGWENGFTEGHFGGEISPASSGEICKNLISGILLHRAVAHSLKTRMGRVSIFFARNPARQI